MRLREYSSRISSLQIARTVIGSSSSDVLVAAGISAAIGQLSKPFTSVLLYGKDLDFKAAFQAGGFPSTHSSVLSALYSTSGLSDSIFGLTVVYAGLIMYDAQKVGGKFSGPQSRKWA
ncbi:hypothetical protein CFP56_003818 [Quercus suber]|uniref:Acid phosphatase/vanadium-dependent haloperoxidase-related protein n=1 Tax=Quercus suber TaxID=58331 RepID=A0AAW0IJ42_QUESU